MTCDEGGVPIGDPISVDEAAAQPVLSDPTTLTSGGTVLLARRVHVGHRRRPDALDSSTGGASS